MTYFHRIETLTSLSLLVNQRTRAALLSTRPVTLFRFTIAMDNMGHV
ncbi:hypothetical protein BJ956_003084 [Arthrobacter psychrochitiniphilus]|nr:hypothetical protein [Arthrobacter psychrochitiniphilus]